MPVLIENLFTFYRFKFYINSLENIFFIVYIIEQCYTRPHEPVTTMRFSSAPIRRDL
jgi:hypothetical protein